MKRLVLAGAGHAHVQVLQAFARKPIPDLEICLLSPEPLAPYSGMVPGWLSGRYRHEEIAIDVRALAQASGARWQATSVATLDPDARSLQDTQGQSLEYDLLSLNVGSTVSAPDCTRATVLPLRPLATLRTRYESLLARFSAAPAGTPAQLIAVGGGAAGFEALLNTLARLRTLRPDRVISARLITRQGLLLQGYPQVTRKAAQRALERAGVTICEGEGWDPALDQVDHILLWATGAEAQPWQRNAAQRGTLAVDAQGFIRINAHLQSVSHPTVFAVGDCASWASHPLPKAGVHAVRMGPVLAENLRRSLQDYGPSTRLRIHHPQAQALALLATGDGRAIASRGPFCAEGVWAWRWKDWIDRGFVGRFQSDRKR